MNVEPLVKFLGEKKFLLGDNVTFADFFFFEALDFYNWASEGELFKTRPALESYHKRIASLPKIAEYLASDQFLEKPFNNKIAKLNNW